MRCLKSIIHFLQRQAPKATALVTQERTVSVFLRLSRRNRCGRASTSALCELHKRNMA
jgi:hypothetical protein